MAHFCKIGKGSKVLTVEVVHNNIATTEQVGIDFLNNLYGTNDVWKQTFTDGTRKNYAGVGYKYDQTRDAFIPPKPYISWILNETLVFGKHQLLYLTQKIDIIGMKQIKLGI